MLPDGKEEMIAAKLGQTVQYTKAILHERFELPMNSLVRNLCCYLAVQACILLYMFASALLDYTCISLHRS